MGLGFRVGVGVGVRGRGSSPGGRVGRVRVELLDVVVDGHDHRHDALVRVRVRASVRVASSVGV